MFCLDLLGTVKFHMISFFTNLSFSFKCFVPVIQHWLRLAQNQGKEAEVLEVYTELARTVKREWNLTTR